MTDFCFSRPMLERVYAQAGFMDRMMQHLGVRRVDAARVDRGMGWYEARTRCLGCQSESRCRAWLAETRVSAEAPSFCANAAFFNACRAIARERDLGQGTLPPAPLRTRQ